MKEEVEEREIHSNDDDNVEAEEKSDFGTREWAVTTRNIMNGCPNACWYCYAAMLNDRFHRVPDWAVDSIAWNRIMEPPKKVKSVEGKFDVMFPSSHDILPHFVTLYTTILLQELRAGKSVLIVTKPNFESIETIVSVLNRFPKYRDKVEFRFTITCDNEELIRFWEPGAPTFEERFKCLQYAREQKYATSVSVEPPVDIPNLEQFINKLLPYVSTVIFVGVMTRIGFVRNRMAEALTTPEAVKIFNAQEEAQKPTPIMLNLVQRLQAIPQVRFKYGGFVDILASAGFGGMKPVAAAITREIKKSGVVKKFKDPKRVAAAHKAWATMRSRLS